MDNDETGTMTKRERLRGALKRFGGFLDDVARPRNWCRSNFGMTFGSLLLAAPMALLTRFHLLTESKGVIVVLILLIPAFWAASRFYDRYVGPRFRARGWNEYSYWKNLLLVPVFVFTLYGSVVLLILVAGFILGF